MRKLTVMAHNIMTRKFIEYYKNLKSINLTKICKYVIFSTPKDLEWKIIGTNTGCCEAISGEHLYSMNLISGTVLIDGRAKGKLDVSITQIIYSSKRNLVKEISRLYIHQMVLQ